MLSFTHYIFSVIKKGETTGLYVTGLYVPSCGDHLRRANLEIKRRMAFIVNKSDTRAARNASEWGNHLKKKKDRVHACFCSAPQKKSYLPTDDDG